ncbi:hypothetical protein BWI86_27495 (plasmid) [Escherichia coli]|nr:hypothetical protein BWI86_27495 [Escherichia coli]
MNKRLARFGIDEQTVTHPVTPKYAKLIATLKEFFPEGKANHLHRRKNAAPEAQAHYLPMLLTLNLQR